jgi:hypothetical protein
VWPLIILHYLVQQNYVMDYIILKLHELYIYYFSK